VREGERGDIPRHKEEKILVSNLERERVVKMKEKCPLWP
jgi:hypothetical protein